MNSNLSFAKIVSSPTASAWSQAYNAGSLFAVISLTGEGLEDDQSLSKTGKQIINNLEAEFFTLEKKDLESIKNAVDESIKELPGSLHLSLVLSFIKDNILYLMLYGPGTILLKRGSELGALLHETTDNTGGKTASGYLQNEDLLLLQTAQFAKLVSAEVIKEACELSLPSDIAETLTPHIHKAEDGGAAALIMTVKGGMHAPQRLPDFDSEATHATDDKTLAEEVSHQTDETEEEPEEESDELSPHPKKHFSLPRFRLPGSNLSLKKRVFILCAILLTIALIGSIFMAMQKQQSSALQKEADALYAAAYKDYDEGVNLINLNPTYARDDLQSAKETLEKGIPKFPKGSPEEQKLSELLAKVNTTLSQSSSGKTVTSKAVDADESPLLKALIDNKDAITSAADDDKIYTLTDAAVLNASNKAVIKNDKDWAAAVGLGAYNGNIYILDTKEGILKYVAGSGGYGKNTYFTGASPDLTKAKDMAIDGSVWILFSDGKVDKYTKGAKDTFTIKGLETEMRTPTRVATSVDMTHLYILDPGTASIIQITKDGTYKAQFRANVLSSATAIDVHEKDKKAYVLSNGKVHEVPLQ